MADEKKILVAYFSWSGTTRNAAKKIADTMNGELFEIVPAKPYSKSYGMTAMKALIERMCGARPRIRNKVQDIGRFEKIVIGFPIWWYCCPMIICSFLKQYDFAGKAVYTFCTHGGSGPSRSLAVMQKSCRTIKDCFDANSATPAKIQNWFC